MIGNYLSRAIQIPGRSDPTDKKFRRKADIRVCLLFTKLFAKEGCIFKHFVVDTLYWDPSKTALRGSHFVMGPSKLQFMVHILWAPVTLQFVVHT